MTRRGKIISGETWDERIERLKIVKTKDQFHQYHKLLNKLQEANIKIWPTLDKLKRSNFIYKKDRELVDKIKNLEKEYRHAILGLKQRLAISSSHLGKKNKPT